MKDKDLAICTSIDQHIKSLIRTTEILWRVTLDDGLEVISDFHRPSLDVAPWHRLKNHCKKMNKYITKVECLMLGIDPFVMFHHPDGLDGVLVLRGASKDMTINDDCSPGTAYKHLIVGVLRPECDIIDVRKFSWPENVLEPFEQTRLLTNDNFKLMIFRDDAKRERAAELLENLQISDNG